jgi:GH25 family lysozyme M1 (1,4-beta-N-acetylmuramidase)
MHATLFANIVVLLSLLGFVAAHQPAAKFEVRQVPATPSQTELCLDYEWTANMSTISANGSYRTVLLQKSNVGTIYNARMMDAAQKKLPTLTADPVLNAACGNKTEIALREAEKNFTMGIVAQFTTEGLPVGIESGPLVIINVAIICVIFSVVWVFAG